MKRQPARRTRTARGWLAVVLAAGLAVSCSASSPGPTPSANGSTGASGPTASAGPSGPSASPSEGVGTNALVTRVVDGDTIEVRFKGRDLTVRLIGIDTPESVAPDQPVECFGVRASRYTTGRLEGRRVRLSFDVERRDQYGRTLAYVWLGEELFNETLVREGYAFVATFPPNVRYLDRLQAAQRDARGAGRGVWGGCVDLAACDPAYPDACIPPPPPDLECSDIDERRFTVLPPDPHHFDGDDNGIGCEEG